MRPSLAASLGLLLTIGLALAASAEDARPNIPTSLTGKEQLGRKWMDEQRIDNCNVPVDKRGTRPRPSTCTHVPTG